MDSGDYDEDGKPLPVIRYDEDLTDEERATTPMAKVVYGPDLRVSKADAVAATAPLGAMAMAMTVREMAKRGGHARWAKLSPERRSEIARAAAQTRWGKR